MKFISKTMDLNIKNAVGYLTFKQLEKYSMINHALSTRFGGVSKNEYKSMNLRFNCDDTKENVIENYKIFCSAAGFDYNSLVAAHQSHTCNIKSVNKADIGVGIYRPQNMTDIDALITDERGVTLVTFHADCAPIFFVEPDKRVIALAHAGWRGTVNGISGKVVKKMLDEYNCNVESIICAIGPSIKGCCFEVGEEVCEEFKNMNIANIDKTIHEDKYGKHKIDILEANKHLLISVGIREENILISDLCTMCNHDLLISHRATNGKRGVMGAMLCLTEDEAVLNKDI